MKSPQLYIYLKHFMKQNQSIRGNHQKNFVNEWQWVGFHVPGRTADGNLCHHLRKQFKPMKANHFIVGIAVKPGYS